MVHIAQYQKLCYYLLQSVQTETEFSGRPAVVASVASSEPLTPKTDRTLPMSGFQVPQKVRSTESTLEVLG